MKGLRNADLTEMVHRPFQAPLSSIYWPTVFILEWQIFLKNTHTSLDVLKGAGIVEWLESRTRDQNVPGSSPHHPFPRHTNSLTFSKRFYWLLPSKRAKWRSRNKYNYHSLCYIYTSMQLWMWWPCTCIKSGMRMSNMQCYKHKSSNKTQWGCLLFIIQM